MERMKFILRDRDRVEFWTKDNNEFIGWFERLRIGRFMQWCQFLDKNCYLTSGCSDEVREMQKRLNAEAKAGITKDIEGLED